MATYQKVFINLDLQGQSMIENCSRLEVAAGFDHIALDVIGYPGGASQIVRVREGSTSDTVLQVTNDGIWEHYMDARWFMDGIHMDNHGVNLLSGTLVNPIIGNAILSGSFDGGGVELASIGDGAGLQSAATITQLDSAISGCVALAPGASNSRNIVQSDGDIILQQWQGVTGGSQTADLVRFKTHATSPNPIARVDSAMKMLGVGFDAQGHRVENVSGALIGTDAANLDVVNSVLSGHTDDVTTDYHTQYIFTAPSTDSRNNIDPTTDAILPLNIRGFSGGHAEDLQRWMPDADGESWAYVDQNAKIFGIGLDAQANEITSATAATAMTSVPTISQVMSIVSGHTDITSGAHGLSSAFVGITDAQTIYNKTIEAPTVNAPVLSGAKGSYYERVFEIVDFGAALTNALMEDDDLLNSLYKSVIARDSVLTDITVNFLHNDTTSPPSSWDLQVFKNGTKSASMNCAINGTALAQSITNGVPHPDRVSFAATDELHLALSGSAIDVILIRVTLGFETNE